MASDRNTSEQSGLMTRLARARFGTAGVMWTERVWPLVVPVLFVVAPVCQPVVARGPSACCLIGGVSALAFSLHSPLLRRCCL